jgi:hypothetical protein
VRSDWSNAKNSAPKFYDFPYLLLILAVFFWSVNSIVGRAVRLDVPPSGWRSGVGAAHRW